MVVNGNDHEWEPATLAGSCKWCGIKYIYISVVPECPGAGERRQYEVGERIAPMENVVAVRSRRRRGKKGRKR